VGVKLSVWARENGVSYRAALNWFDAGTLPVPAQQLPSGTILVNPPIVETAGASWAELRRQLEYKSAAVGVRLVVADRWFASSKTCSGCGTAKAKLALSERTYVCTACGLILDRDVNAALKLAALAADTGELRRELPDGSDVRPVVLARPAVAPPREESITTQRRLREEATR